jgi:hypothetical protein
MFQKNLIAGPADMGRKKTIRVNAMKKDTDVVGGFYFKFVTNRWEIAYLLFLL